MAQKTSIQYIRYYTAGTAAIQLEDAVPQHRKATLPAPRKIKRKNVYIDPVAVLGVLVAVSMLIVMAVGIVELRQTQQEAALMQTYVNQLTRENERLTQAYADAYDLEEIEKTALALGMVPGWQAPQTQITVSVPEQVQTASVWEQIGTFLTGLFA